MTGSWVAVPTPFDDTGAVDMETFRGLIDFHSKWGTSALLLCGSAGEVSALALAERYAIIREMAPYAADKLPTFFGISCPTTRASMDLAKHAEDMGASGIVVTAPAYSLPPQSAVLDYLASVASSVEIPVAIYNNPSRVVVNIAPETVAEVHRAAPNFLYDKEAAPSSGQLMQVWELTAGEISIFCCDNPNYGLIPAALTFGSGIANISGNLDPQSVARLADPFGSSGPSDEWRQVMMATLPLMRACYRLTNPMMIKAGLEYIGLPCGTTRLPLPPVEGEVLQELHAVLDGIDARSQYGLAK